MQRYTEAIPCFDRASELGGPGTEELYFWKALALFNDGQVEAGRKILIDFLASKRGTAKDIAAAEKALQAMKPKA